MTHRRALTGVAFLMLLFGCSGSPDQQISEAGDPHEDLQAAVASYSDGVFTGDPQAYTLLTERCRDRITAEQFQLILDQAKTLYGSPLPIKTFNAEIVGNLARVTYPYELAAVNQTSEPWAKEDGDWKQDDCPRDTATETTSKDGSGREAQGKPARMLKTGFGQSGEYAWVTSLVENQSAGNIGQFVTVQFNLYDKRGEIAASTEQVEQFSMADQKMAIGTQVKVPDREKIAKVEATLHVSDYDSGRSEAFPEIKTGKVKVAEDEFNGTVARFEVHNPTKESLKMVRIGVICYDAKERVIGGGVDYPNLVPPSGKVLSEVHLITSGNVDRCEAYAGPGE